jgi:hypothetical protein
MSNVSITKVETVNGENITTLFDPFVDTITLRLVIDVSQQLATMPGAVARFTWQLIELRTNAVVYNVTEDNVKLSGASTVRWGHIGSAHDVGLQWGQEDVFGFRGAVEVFGARDRVQPMPDALAVSAVAWFQLANAAAL